MTVSKAATSTTAVLRQCPAVLDGLTGHQRRALENAIATNVLEGWAPTQCDIERLAALGRGELTAEDYVADVRARRAPR